MKARETTKAEKKGEGREKRSGGRELVPLNSRENIEKEICCAESGYHRRKLKKRGKRKGGDRPIWLSNSPVSMGQVMGGARIP